MTDCKQQGTPMPLSPQLVCDAPIGQSIDLGMCASSASESPCEEILPEFATIEGSFEGDCWVNSCNKRNVVGKTFQCGKCKARGFDTLPPDPERPGEFWDCRRKTYTGDPLTCCLNDYTCAQTQPGNYNKCFSDDSLQHTCDPQYRDVTSSECNNLVFSYCAITDIDDYSDLSWMERWLKPDGSPGPCYNAMLRNLFNNGVIQCNTGTIDPQSQFTCSGIEPVAQNEFSYEGFTVWSQVVTLLFDAYRKAGLVIGSAPGSKTYSGFADFLYNNICCKYPALCVTSLQRDCSRYSLANLPTNPYAASFCGCYLPDGNYTPYINSFQVNKECTPSCNKENAIKLINSSSVNTVLNCTQNVCVVDDVNIQITRSTINGNIDINQMCGNCNGAQQNCSCFIQYANIDIANSQVNGDINFGQACGNSNCFEKNPNPGNGLPNFVQVPCDSPNNPFFEYEAKYNAYVDTQEQRQVTYTFVYFFGIFILLLALGLLIYAFTT